MFKSLRLFTYAIIFFETAMFAGLFAANPSWLMLPIVLLFWVCFTGPWCRLFLREGF